MASRLASTISRIVVLRNGEAPAALLMFAYSFLAMTSYNIVKPITRSKFINSFGADNLPWILLGAGLLIGVLMHHYTRAISRLPRRSVVPVTLTGIIAIQLAFWALLRTEWEPISAGLYVFGQILGILLISQFWTLANDIYDARQAKRLFGFIGGGASLGGALGSAVTSFFAQRLETENLLLISAATLGVCAWIVILIVRRQDPASLSTVEDERGVGSAEALRLLAQSPQLRIIALVIGLAVGGAAIVEQQLNIVAEATGASEGDVAAFLARVQMWLSLAGFVVQVAFTSRIHRSLGLAVALLLLPFTLGTTAAIILLTGATWAPQIARVADSTLRYTVDKTTREILFLPLPSHLRHRAKPFIDVTMDRFSKAVAAILLLVLVQPWGLALDWRQLSYASLAITGVWIAAALVARREYLAAFRRSIGSMTIAPEAIRPDVTDAATIEALVEELSNPDESAVLYAITMLETLNRRNLITPLLLQHTSAQVRTRALMALSSTRFARKWVPAIERMVQDPDVDVRAAALRALAALSREDASALMRRHLNDPEPRVAVAAAATLADSGDPADADVSDSALRRLIADTREAATAGRIECATALAHIRNPQFRSLLVPLLYDHDTRVVQEAIRSARKMGVSDGLFLPGLLSLLGHRVLKADARDTLVGYGEPVIGALAHALRDRREHIWLRRHIPATLALIPSQQSMDALVASLEEPDGFLRYKAIAAIERLTREHPHIRFPQHAIEALLVQETSRYYNSLTLHYNLLQHAPKSSDSLLGRAITDKMTRALDRIYRLLGLLYHVDDIAAARYTIEQGETRRRAQAIEYLDNLLGGMVRRRVLPILDDTPLAEKVRHANGVLKSRPREVEDTLAQLIHDDDPVVSASAIHYVATNGLWSLTGDIEYAATRRIDDPVVAQAAMWALLRRHHAKPPERTVAETLPAVELADRVRAIVLFQYVSVDELFRIAGVGEEVRYAAGRELRPSDAVADVEFLIEGRVDCRGETLSPPAALGLEEVLSGSPPASGLVATEPTMCFRIAGPAFLTMLADNVLLAQGLFRMLLAPADHVPPLLLPAPAPDTPARPLTAQAVDLVLVLRHHPLFERATAAQLLALTAAAHEIVLTEGATLFGPEDIPAIHVVLAGEVVIDAPQSGPIVAPVGSTIGVAETLAGISSGSHARVTRGGRALRLERERLFGVLGDEVELMQGLFSGVLTLTRKTAELT